MILRHASTLGLLNSFFYKVKQELKLSCIDLNYGHSVEMRSTYGLEILSDVKRRKGRSWAGQY